MARNILILNGHPDAASTGLCHALASAYEDGARSADNVVRRLDVAKLEFGLLHSEAAFEKDIPPPAIMAAQESTRWSNHLVLIFPLWLGDMPAVLKAFFEQALRPGFAFTYRPSGFPIRHLAGRSAHIIVTMGMPALVYRWYFRARAQEPEAQRPEVRRLRTCARHPGRSHWHAQPGGHFATDAKASDRRTPVYSFRLAASLQLGRDWRGVLPRVSAPTEILVGTNDELFNADQFKPMLESVSPRIGVTIVPDETHLGMIADPPATTAIVAAWRKLAGA